MKLRSGLKRLVICMAAVAISWPSVLLSAPAKTAGKSWPATMTIAVPDPGTTGNLMGVALSKLLEEKLGIRATVTVAGSEERLRLTARGEVDLGVSVNDTTFNNAVQGVGTFAKDGKQPVRYLSYLYPLLLHIITRADTGIKSIPDTKGKRFMYIYRGSPAEVLIPALLEFHKMTPQDVTGLRMGTAAEGFNAVVARSADVGIRNGGRRGVAGIKEAALKTDLVFLSLSQAEVDYVQGKYPYYGNYTMAAGIYKGQDYPVLSLTEGWHTVVRSDMPDDLVYAIAKILLDTCGPSTPGQFSKYHRDLDWTLDDLKGGLKLAPMHPGLVTYLKDRKLWTDEMEQAQRNKLKMAK